MPERNRATCDDDDIREFRTCKNPSFAWKMLGVAESVAGGIMEIGMRRCSGLKP
jgi:hypothetical protein